MKAGVIGSLATSSSASCSVAVTLGLAGLSKPRWLSLICTKVKSLPAASALPIRRERGTPPATVQTMAVPAQVMHLRKPRRCKFGSMLMDGLLLARGRPPAPAARFTDATGGLFPPRSGIRSAVALYGRTGARSQDQGLAPGRPTPTLRVARSAASRCCVQPCPLAGGQHDGCRGRGAGRLSAGLPLFRRLSRRKLP